MSWQCACSIVGGPLHTDTPWPHTSHLLHRPRQYSFLNRMPFLKNSIYITEVCMYVYVVLFVLFCSVNIVGHVSFPNHLCFFFCLVGSHNQSCPHIWRLLFAAIFLFFSVPLRSTYCASLRTWWTIYVSIRIVSETVCLQNLRNGWNRVGTVQCFSQFFLCSWIAFIYSYSILLTFILILMLVISMIVKIF